MNPIQQGMVKSMNYAATVPHFYLMEEVDVSKLVRPPNGRPNSER